MSHLSAAGPDASPGHWAIRPGQWATRTDSAPIVVAANVAQALADAQPVVALESTLIAHGLPKPQGAAVAAELEQTVEAGGAVPATVAVIDGALRVGLTPAQRSAVASRDDVAKAQIRDLGVSIAHRSWAATTAAATAWAAHAAGIRVFATGGLGGVHREAQETFDESGDLTALATTPVVIVCAGVKSILDVPATLERLETHHVPVLGWRTRDFPGFWVTDSGCDIETRVDSAAEVAAIYRTQRALGLSQALVVAVPLSAGALDPAIEEAALASGMTAARDAGVRGKALTPFLLSWMHEHTDGASLRANIALVHANARVAAEIACALAADAA